MPPQRAHRFWRVIVILGWALLPLGALAFIAEGTVHNQREWTECTQPRVDCREIVYYLHPGWRAARDHASRGLAALLVLSGVAALMTRRSALGVLSIGLVVLGAPIACEAAMEPNMDSRNRVHELSLGGSRSFILTEYAGRDREYCIGEILRRDVFGTLTVNRACGWTNFQQGAFVRPETRRSGTNSRLLTCASQLLAVEGPWIRASYDVAGRRSSSGEQLLELSPFLCLGGTSRLHAPDVAALRRFVTTLLPGPGRQAFARQLIEGQTHPNPEVRRLSAELTALLRASEPKSAQPPVDSDR